MIAPIKTASRRNMLITSSLALGLLGLIILLALLETILHLLGFSYSSIPREVSVQFDDTVIHDMNKRSGRTVFEKDARLLWRLRPGATIGVQTVNAAGFLGRDFNPEAPLTIACCGDSCTALGLGPYPERLASDLELVLGSGRASILNAGIPGYSSLQGLRLLERLLEQNHFDYVSFYFGWNDHWQALSKPDSTFIQTSTPIVLIQNRLAFLRTYQLLVFLFKGVTGRAKIDPTRTGTEHYRVPLADFTTNLEQWVGLARRHHAVPILMTAPAGPDTESPTNDQTEPGSSDFLQHTATEFHVHKAYNQSVREVAARLEVGLLDLEHLFNESGQRFLIMNDGIHLAPAGLQLVSDNVLDFLIDQHALPADSLIKARARRTFSAHRPNVMTAAIEIEPSDLTGPPGQNRTLRVRLNNTGDTVWNTSSAYDFAIVRLGCSLYDRDGQLLERDYARFTLPHDCMPAETLEFDISLTLPAEPGHYRLEFDPVNEGVAWFKKWGSPVCSIRLHTT
ncbi:hypothetical protein JXQ70_09285 [bacterium]|nr:hypothetical protein [bacterium]